MTDVEITLQIVLASGSPLPTSAGDRVYAVTRKQGSAVPAVSYQRISSIPIDSLAGASGIDLVRVQIDCWAKTLKEARILAGEVRTAMDAAALTGVLKNRPDTGFDEYEQETALFRCSADYMCWQK